MKIGEWDYNNRCVAQARGVPELLNEVGEELKSQGDLPTTIIEVGTYYGGFTEMLKDSVLSEACEKIITYDILDRASLAEHFADTKVDFRQANIFEHGVYSAILNEVQTDGKSIVFCDGGDKCKEFINIAPHLKKGDLILAHDYAHDVNFFTENLRDVVWNWFELEYGRIRGTCEAYGLERCEFTDRFEKKAWACFQKV